MEHKFQCIYNNRSVCLEIVIISMNIKMMNLHKNECYQKSVDLLHLLLQEGGKVLLPTKIETTVLGMAWKYKLIAPCKSASGK